MIDVRSSTFPWLARTVNAIPRDVDPSQQSVSRTFPAPPFIAHLLLPEAQLLFALASTYGVAMLVAWLAITSESWQQSTFLRRAFFRYAFAVVVVIATAIVALRVPLT